MRDSDSVIMRQIIRRFKYYKAYNLANIRQAYEGISVIAA